MLFKFWLFIHQMTEKFLKIPLVWIFLGGLFVSYFIFFFTPTFLNSTGQMLQTMQAIPPRLNGIGGDHLEIVDEMSKPFMTAEPKYVLRGPYPPLSLLLHIPFTFFESATSYRLITLLNLVVLLIFSLLLPLYKKTKDGNASILIVVFLTGLFSYGFAFEVERGQYNLIAFCFTMSAIWVFHYKPQLRWLAYLFFTIAVQLKVYPAIFILNLIDDWRDWKGIVHRFIGLGSLNFAMLFILGIDNFFRFFNTISTIMGGKLIPSAFNHSAESFAEALAGRYPSLYIHASAIQYSLLLISLLGLFTICYQAYKQNFKGINPFIILACAAIAQIIPQISYDYTLSILPVAMAFFFATLNRIEDDLASTLLIFLISVIYSSTLFPLEYKFALKDMLPVFAPFINNFPALIMLVVLSASLSFYGKSDCMQNSRLNGV
jgi:hypothetical protein